jgi:uncharacterized secreted protein with C-terminal beta-propeller domain
VTLRHVLAMVALGALAACAKSQAPVLPPSTAVDESPVLRAATSCSALETAIEDSLVLQMKSEVEQIRQGWGGWVLPAGGVATTTVNTPTAAAGPSSYTTTNSQVAGVTEADFVQNDGTRIAALADGKLHLVSSWPAETMSEVASLAIEGWPRELFLSGSQVIVFSTIYTPRPIEGLHPICVGPPVGLAAVAVPAFCAYSAADMTKVTTVDVSTLSAPKVTAQIYLPGSYLASRLIGNRVRLVMNDDLLFPDGVQLYPDLTNATTTAERNAAFDALEAKNEALIRGRSLDDWLRKGSVTRSDGTTVPLPYTCSDFAIGTAPVRPGLLTIATVDLSLDALVSRTTVLAQADVVYASTSTLYAAASHFWVWPAVGQSDATYLHAFDLTDPDHSAYLGSGTVEGLVNDQYQIDEYHGAVRVASTLQTRVADTTIPWGRLAISNEVTALQLSGGALKTIGKTGPFGDGERLFGTRFVGPRGFAITARQVDPLFTFDLSDPTQPKKVGELSIPGYIAYLHPIDDTHLLGVGRELASPTGPMQVKVQLLDVTDLTAPKSVSTVVVGQGYSWSDSLWDPKAFTWYAAGSMLAIPFADFAPMDFVSDLRLFKVDPTAGITPSGALPFADVYQTVTGPGWSFAWSPYVRRGILADAYVYGVSDAGIRSAKVADLPAWLTTVTFTPLVATPVAATP